MPTVTRGDSSRPTPTLDDIKFRALGVPAQVDPNVSFRATRHGYLVEWVGPSTGGVGSSIAKFGRHLGLPGKYYFEFWSSRNRLSTDNPAFFNAVGLQGNNNSVAVFFPSSIWNSTTRLLAASGNYNQGDVGGLAVDSSASPAQFWFRNSPTGIWNGDLTADPATGVGGAAQTLTGPLYPAVLAREPRDIIGINFGEENFVGAVPAGFSAAFTAGSFEADEAAGFVIGSLDPVESYDVFGGSLAISGGADAASFRIANGNQLAMATSVVAGPRTIDVTATAPSGVKRSPLTKTFILNGAVTGRIILGTITQLQSTWPADTALGTTLATISQTTWDDGRPFTGSLIFGSPNFNNGVQTAADGGTTGVFRLVTNNDKSGLIQLNPNGPGLGAPVTQITDHVSVTAIQ